MTKRNFYAILYIEKGDSPGKEDGTRQFKERTARNYIFERRRREAAGVLFFAPQIRCTDMSRKRSYLACVSLRYDSEYIIRTAGCIAEDDARSRLSVVSVLTDPPSAEQLEAMEFLRETSRESGANMTILYNQSPVLAAVDHIKRHKITHVIAGMPSSGESEGDFVSLLRAVLPKVSVILIPRPVPVAADQTSAVSVL